MNKLKPYVTTLPGTSDFAIGWARNNQEAHNHASRHLPEYEKLITELCQDCVNERCILDATHPQCLERNCPVLANEWFHQEPVKNHIEAQLAFYRLDNTDITKWQLWALNDDLLNVAAGHGLEMGGTMKLKQENVQ